MNTDITQAATSPEIILDRQDLSRNPTQERSEPRSTGPRPDVYTIITERIISLLEQEIIPWKKPWRTGKAAFPKNLVSGRAYSGINAFLLAMVPFESPYFLTFKQAHDMGGRIQKGGKGFPIIYWNKSSVDKIDGKTGDTKSESYAFLRYYTVFNVQQTEGIPVPILEGVETQEFTPIEACEAIYKGFLGAPEIVHHQHRACYSPSLDLINMPRPETFDSEENYYAILFHEMTHSTGHQNRLKREGIVEDHHFGDEDYSKEELIAEMGAAFLCAHAGTAPMTLGNSAAYIASWLKKLRNDKKLVIQAAAAAQKAADLILGHSRTLADGD